ncbi:uncharacterized protein LOC105444708 [Strongylocentrotus purpuratus]|uniref:Uncharacterized protein n=1 Tax=Strongylocentrotus purpuratus TaxID=7668 RepID=A0A7M7P010_STRPU|nr:uncharacterized protein LOC105444708 [Strongylocentrotus purpuratus]
MSEKVQASNQHEGSEAGEPKNGVDGDATARSETRASRDAEVKSMAFRASISSSVKMREAEVKRQLARMKVVQLQREHKLKREQFELNEKLDRLKIENELENAEAEAKLWQEHETKPQELLQIPEGQTQQRTAEWCTGNVVPVDICNENQDVTSQRVLGEHTMPNAYTCNKNVNSVEHNLSEMMMAMHLPKPDMTCFSGNPIDYWSFCNCFDVNIEHKVQDNRMRLTYLIQFCTGKAREAIENCILLHPDTGYSRARSILQDQFGQNYIVAKAHVDRVICRANLRPSDSQALWDLARDMRRCQMSTSQMGYSADMSSTDTLLKIQSLLPVHLQARWASKAHVAMEQSVIPNFSHMTDFIEQEAKIASNVFGKNIGQSFKSSSSAKRQKGSVGGRASSFAMEGGTDRPNNRKEACPCCKKEHQLETCFKLRDLPQKERFIFLKKSGICFNCLKKAHLARNCPSDSTCKKEGCSLKWKHHTWLHFERKEGPNQKNNEDSPSQQNGAGVTTGVECHTIRGRADVRLRVLPVKVRHGAKEVTTWALLDEGSDTSLCEKRLAEELGIVGVNKEFRLTTINGVNTPRKGMEVSMTIQGLQEDTKIDVDRMWTVDVLPISSRSIPCQEDVDKWPHLQGIQLVTAGQAKVQLLIGGDTPEAFWVEEERRGQKKDPYAIRTPLGWTLIGPASSSSHRNSYGIHHISAEELHNQVKRFWEMDSGPGDERVGESVEDVKARTIMEKTVKYIDGHYEIGLPWRQCPPVLPNNRQQAGSRLQSLKKRLQKNGSLHQKYSSVMGEYIRKGFACKVGEGREPVGRVWYLPHHPVINPLKPDKLRIVYDCAAEFQGTSLNSQLLQGPDYTNKLVGVLLRFRQDKIALASDIEGMFHQVRVSPQDIDALRFLWWEEGDLEKPPVEYQMLVHLFGATSSPSCAGFAINKTVQDNKRDFDEGVAETVLDNFYVDDCLKSVSTREEAKKLIPQLNELLRRGGFRLTKWVSNDKEVLSTVETSERAASVVDLDLDHLPIERTLGIMWNMETDTFSFKVKPKEVPATRRGILSSMSSLYDPLGFVAPFIVTAKILLQDLCAQGKGWDEEVGQEELQRWEKWLAEIPELTSINIERCYKPTDFEGVTNELHIFCDASERAYAACAYLRIVGKEGQIHTAFVMGKTRLCPLKKMTIPRLELSAAVLAVQLYQIIQEELRIPIDRVTYWTDSTSVLLYISNESRRFRTFVANRVAKIHKISDKRQWRHVDTLRNSADDGSRGIPARSLDRWLTGPEFLLQEKEVWPEDPASLKKEDVPELDLQNDSEVKKTHVYATSSHDEIDDLMTRYSSWDRLKRGIAWLLRYKQYLRSKGTGNLAERGSLTVQELNNAEVEVIKHVQRHSFPDEYVKGIEKKTRKQGNPLEKLNPVMVDGLLRVGGRLSKAPILNDEKHPMILPNDHHVTKLLVVHHHQKVGHCGMGSTWTSLRERFWINKGGATVRHTIGNCFKCRKRNASRGQQFMADLPEERVTPGEPPFTNTGLDYFGPFPTKHGRSTQKRYGCIFTCLSTRAVHLEMAYSLETDSFIQTLRRFINRRGQPKAIFSDNGTNFKGGQKELKDALAGLNSERVNRYLTQKGIAWHFNPPGASHMGGVWERIIRSVRKILTSLPQQTLTDEALLTLFTEVEAILNGRPLTHLSMDSRDDEPLTPNHLLLLRKNPSLPPGIFVKEDCHLRRHWRQVQYLAGQFWTRWVKEYLPLLQQRQKWTRPNRNFEVDDLVLVVNESTPRGQWPIGRVLTTYPDKRGLVRQVEVRVGPRYYKRPISKLCLLEANVEASS